MKFNPNNLFVNNKGSVMIDTTDTNDTSTAYKRFIPASNTEKALVNLILCQWNETFILKNRIITFNQAFENLKETL